MEKSFNVKKSPNYDKHNLINVINYCSAKTLKDQDILDKSPREKAKELSSVLMGILPQKVKYVERMAFELLKLSETYNETEKCFNENPFGIKNLVDRDRYGSEEEKTNAEISQAKYLANEAELILYMCDNTAINNYLKFAESKTYSFDDNSIKNDSEHLSRLADYYHSVERTEKIIRNLIDRQILIGNPENKNISVKRISYQFKDSYTRTLEMENIVSEDFRFQLDQKKGGYFRMLNLRNKYDGVPGYQNFNNFLDRKLEAIYENIEAADSNRNKLLGKISELKSDLEHFVEINDEGKMRLTPEYKATVQDALEELSQVPIEERSFGNPDNSKYTNVLYTQELYNMKANNLMNEVCKNIKENALIIIPSNLDSLKREFQLEQKLMVASER